MTRGRPKAQHEAEPVAKSGEYEVRSIRDYNPKSKLFRVNWEGYSSDEDTWQPLSSLKKAQGAIDRFWASRKEAKVPPSSNEIEVKRGIGDFKLVSSGDETKEDGSGVESARGVPFTLSFVQ